MASISQNSQGALLMMCSMAAFTVNDAFIKATDGAVPLFQLLAIRGTMATLFLIGLTVAIGHFRLRARRRDWGLSLLRALAETAAAYFFLTALLNMPIANVTAILQCLPLTVTLGAALFLGERVGWRRYAAIACGFCGMLLIVRPGPQGVDIFAVYGLIAVLCVTLRDLVTRRISPAMPSMMVTVISALVVTLLAAILSIEEGWVPISAPNRIYILAAAVTIIGGYAFSVLVMRVGEVSYVAPFRYSGLLWALILGWFVFGDWPDPVTLTGAGIVVASGLYMLYRESRTLRSH